MDLSLSDAASEERFVNSINSKIEKVDYIGKQLLPGNDLTICVDAQKIAVFVDGQLSRVGCWFPRGTEPVFPPRSEPPLSMVF